MDVSPACPFCGISQAPAHDRILHSNEHAFVIRDGYPVTEGHSLIIPHRHVGSFFDLTPAEQEAMFSLLEQAKADLDHSLNPAGYNIGINDGAAAGQTVPHCHLHLIPRYNEPGKDPRGGVRWVVPEKADYWSNA
ncbi:HIT family protein [Aestuariicella hydrocarbonica]|uniref:HIT family protein n=1 Tax=Pseudomaricurvus hydrocarbonicus TaxID=1470433 RepID=A0A9E5MP84_9GAMM|nr:HIT family protein [Aestuariicella hydrocarbonica]NHO67916.1 HIT family protein [Aestuariicella hydrocarbonica]